MGLSDGVVDEFVVVVVVEQGGLRGGSTRASIALPAFWRVVGVRPFFDLIDRGVAVRAERVPGIPAKGS